MIGVVRATSSYLTLEELSFTYKMHQTMDFIQNQPGVTAAIAFKILWLDLVTGKISEIMVGVF